MRHRGRRVHVLRVIAAALAVSAAPLPTLAYCRTTTDTESDVTRCDAPCVTTGIPLDWGEPCVGFSVNLRGGRMIAVDRVAAVADAAFARWTTEVDCAEGPIGISVIRHPDLVQCDSDAFSIDDGNVNVLAFVEDWDERDYDQSAFALTQVKFLVSSGRIVDADLLMNEDRWTFTECPADGCTDGRVDLENTLVHEAGHFLGLSHAPDDPAAVMWACAEPGETERG